MAHPATRPATARASILAAAVAALGLSLSGCETVQIGTDDTQPGDTTSSMVSLTLLNQRQKDPGPLTFMLYGPNTQDIENVAPITEFDSVGFEKTLVVQVKTGRWKIAYSLPNGDLVPMPLEKIEDTDAEWPVATFTKGKTYQILIETDIGNHTVWQHNIPVTASP